MPDQENNPNNAGKKEYDSNIDGEVAEGIILWMLNHNGFVSRVRRLGDKWPRIDIYGEFEENGKVYFFFFQVKSTRIGFTPGGKLNVAVTKEDLNEIARFNAPTYVIGVDLHDPSTLTESFILTVRGEYKEGFSVMISNDDNMVSPANLAKLRVEIMEFWDNTTYDNKLKYKTSFLLKE